MFVRFKLECPPVRSFRFAAVCWATCAALTLGCARQTNVSNAAAPSATAGSSTTGTTGAVANASGRIGPTIQTALQLHLLTPAPTLAKTMPVRHVTHAEMQRALDRAESLLARSERSDNSWESRDRSALTVTDNLRSRALASNDIVAKDMLTDLVQGEDFLYRAADDAHCSSTRGAAVAYLRNDATAYLRAAREYITMAARDLAHRAPNPDDWSAPVPEVHEEEGEGCGG